VALGRRGPGGEGGAGIGGRPRVAGIRRVSHAQAGLLAYNKMPLRQSQRDTREDCGSRGSPIPCIPLRPRLHPPLACRPPCTHARAHTHGSGGEERGGRRHGGQERAPKDQPPPPQQRGRGSAQDRAQIAHHWIHCLSAEVGVPTLLRASDRDLNRLARKIQFHFCEGKDTGDDTVPCYLWGGSRKFFYHGHPVPVRRLVYFLCIGDLNDGLSVEQTCNQVDGHLCIQPLHLRLRGEKSQVQGNVLAIHHSSRKRILNARHNALAMIEDDGKHCPVPPSDPNETALHPPSRRARLDIVQMAPRWCGVDGG